MYRKCTCDHIWISVQSNPRRGCKRKSYKELQKHYFGASIFKGISNVDACDEDECNGGQFV